ncbi:GntR family transcriptional regulator [Sagittula stellata]|uniref:Transcriptional regulator, GntR family protein n=1 Tax=Sagittula stellata (strain ATCC 700073 / DSM 11524 / E-37) TaxID=388399 RepID=A3JXL8_SAGS3|nr:GntR family transcriptional regulator [Sagittula stellata]EBA10254.1 transcriptional regulator, GntR family protein [Sagittula stellata E-37]
MRDISTQHQQIYQTLREQLISGQFSPGTNVSARAISQTMGVGLMPVRGAITRLVGERALEVQRNGRICVPALTAHRFEELMQARRQLEPLCAMRALPFMTPEKIADLQACDERMNQSYMTGDAGAYMRENYQFHFTLYRAGESEVLVPLLESVWMQFGPFMRSVFSMEEKSDIVDKHLMAIEAIRRSDADALGLAIHADIADAVHLLKQTLSDGSNARPLASNAAEGGEAP